jgi:hypothetical protein
MAGRGEERVEDGVAIHTPATTEANSVPIKPDDIAENEIRSRPLKPGPVRLQ